MTRSLRLLVLGALCLAYYCCDASKLASKAGLDDPAAAAAAATLKEDTLQSNMLPEEEPLHVTKGPKPPLSKPTKGTPAIAKGSVNECKSISQYGALRTL